MRDHCLLGETGVKCRIVLPELGLENYVMLVISSHRGSRDTEHRGLSQVSSILVNRFFVLFCFLKKIETVD